MNKLILLIILLGFCKISLAAEVFDITEQKPLGNNLGTYRAIEFNLEPSEESNSSINIYQVTLNNSYQAEIYAQAEKNQLFAKALDEICQDNKILLGINGSYYTPEFMPVGLFIDQGRLIQKYKKSKLLSSCIGISPNHQLFLEAVPNNCLQAYSALQTGPWLINQNRINQNLERLQARPEYLETFFNRNRRTVIAESADNKIIILVSPSATLLELATILKNYPQAFGVKKIMTALNLDGGSSTGLFAQFDKDNFYYPELKRVKTMVLFYDSRN